MAQVLSKQLLNALDNQGLETLVLDANICLVSSHRDSFSLSNSWKTYIPSNIIESDKYLPSYSCKYKW